MMKGKVWLQGKIIIKGKAINKRSGNRKGKKRREVGS